MKNSLTITIIVILVIITAACIIISPKYPNESSLPIAATFIEPTYPEATNYIVDTAGVLTKTELDNITALLKTIETNKTQIGVLLIKSTSPLSIEEYSIRLAEKWKVGMKGLDNGAIIIIATEDRNIRLEIGYGLEGTIPDAIAGQIIRNDMGPFLHDNKWYDAIVAGINSINNKTK